jgi:hypothetical protein
MTDELYFTVYESLRKYTNGDASAAVTTRYKEDSTGKAKEKYKHLRILLSSCIYGKYSYNVTDCRSHYTYTALSDRMKSE